MNRVFKIAALAIAIMAGIYIASDILPSGNASGSATPETQTLSGPRPVPMYTIASGQTGTARSYPGTAESGSEVDLSFRVAGPLVAVNVGPGSVVKKGQALMQIDPRDYRDNIAVISAQLTAARAEYDNAKLEFERVKPLIKKGVVSQSDYDRAERAHATAMASVKNIEAQLAIARHKLGDTTLRAPFDGIVTTQLVENHEMISAGQKALKMHDTSSIEIHVNIPETVLSNYNLNTQQTVDATFPAIPGRTFKAHMSEWSAEADPQTRTYEVTFTLPAPSGNGEPAILPGMTAEISWSGMQKAASPLSIPASALVADDKNQSQVWVFNPETQLATKRSIVTGKLVDGSRFQVLDGLEEGETIVVAGVDFITPEMKLRPMNRTSR